MILCLEALVAAAEERLAAVAAADILAAVVAPGLDTAHQTGDMELAEAALTALVSIRPPLAEAMRDMVPSLFLWPIELNPLLKQDLLEILLKVFCI